MASPVDVDELFSKCMTESDTEKLTARTVVTQITSPFAIHCDKFAPKDEKEERKPAFEELLSQYMLNRTCLWILKSLFWTLT